VFRPDTEVPERQKGYPSDIYRFSHLVRVRSPASRTLFVINPSLSRTAPASWDVYLVDLAHSIMVALTLLGHHANMKPAPEPEKQQLDGVPSKRWLIVVARGQTELYAHLVQAFSRDSKVRVILDRRRDDSRNSPQVTHRLRTHGAVIIRQADDKK